VTSKLQVTIPKVIAQRYGIEPGVQIEWLPAGEAIRVVPHADLQRAPDRERRLALFDRATERQRLRPARGSREAATTERGWRREDLYARGSAG
jgi:bifunctional DNA-binding transcriptional regulator/antitoxin component of YhaV-PrlF toxin-antitoxin module